MRGIEGDGAGGVGQRRRDAAEIVVLKGVALYAADVAASIAEGIERAREAVGSGAAKRKLEQFVAVTQKLGSANA
jgi:anthranilate phosphoribosyltransferase